MNPLYLNNSINNTSNDLCNIQNTINQNNNYYSSSNHNNLNKEPLEKTREVSSFLIKQTNSDVNTENLKTKKIKVDISRHVLPFIPLHPNNLKPITCATINKNSLEESDKFTPPSLTLTESLKRKYISIDKSPVNSTRNNLWQQEEDKKLIQLVLEQKEENPTYKTDWIKIASSLPGKSSKQCFDRWSYTLDPNLNKKPWTEEESKKLEELVSSQKDSNPHDKIDWRKVAFLLNSNRTSKQCYTRDLFLKNKSKKNKIDLKAK